MAKVVLLLADHAPRPHDAKPGDGLKGGEAVLAHQLQRDEGARAPQAGFAVDGNDALG